MISDNNQQSSEIRNPSEQEVDATAMRPPIDGWPKNKWGNPIKKSKPSIFEQPQTEWR